MFVQKLIKGLKEIPLEIRRIRTGRYPDFVTSRFCRPLNDEVPVFMFHAVERTSFEAQLRYLRENGYRTLSLAEFVSFLEGKWHLPGPSVLLTFDDGDRSWYEVGLPLLKQYGCKAVGFLVPHYLREEAGPTGEPGWLSWAQASELQASGVMDLESHSYSHSNVFVGTEVVDFCHPDFERNPLEMDTPWIPVNGQRTNRLQLGTPIYRHTSRFAGLPAFLDNPAVREGCVRFVEAQGGREFFSKSGWRARLLAQHRRLVKETEPGRFESAEECCRAILADLAEARRVLRDRIGRDVRHLCYPQGIGSELAAEISRQAGYQSNFWIATARNTNRSGQSPFFIPRVKDDYITRLPGKGRSSLAGVFALKLRRRARKLYIY
jgi:peptidoglycan/xylan/chitin deacetylase (PgdA/CDA1 family)